MKMIEYTLRITQIPPQKLQRHRIKPSCFTILLCRLRSLPLVWPINEVGVKRLETNM